MCGYRSWAFEYFVQLGDPKPPGLSPLVCVAARLSRAAISIDNTDFLSVTDFFAPKGGKPHIFRVIFLVVYRLFSKITILG